MRENHDAIVIEAGFNEINQNGLSAVGKNIEDDYPDHKIEFYSSVEDGIVFVLRPK